MSGFLVQVVASLLVSLRIAPTLAFAPPFTLIRIPLPVRVMIAISVAGWLVASHASSPIMIDPAGRGIAMVALSELLLGAALALSLQLAFAAILTAGRSVDVQAGFGMAALVDPTTRAQMPLVGTIFAYAAAAIFFSIDGPADLLAIWSESLDRVPLGSAAIGGDTSVLGSYISAVFVIAFGLGGAVTVTLFVVDLAIAFMSRTLPQMNVMLLGFQVKTLIMLALLPLSLAVSGALFLRILRYALETAPRLIA